MSRKNNDKIKKKESKIIGYYIDIYELDKAKILIDRYISQYGHSSYIDYREACLEKKKQNFDKEIEILTKLYENTEEYKDRIICELGLAYYKIGNIEKAIQVYEKIDNIECENKTYVYFQLGKIYKEKNEDDKALEYFNYILHNKCSIIIKEWTKFFVGEIKYKAGQYKDALKIFNSITYDSDMALNNKILYYVEKLQIDNGYEEPQKQKVINRESQIAKFNRRYGI